MKVSALGRKRWRRAAIIGFVVPTLVLLVYLWVKTGGGIPGNLPRSLPADVDARLDPRRWERPRIFDEIARVGEVDEEELRRVFNLGLGMVLAVDPATADAVTAATGGRIVGDVVPGTGTVRW